MKAIICPKYGPPEILRIMEVPTPAPKENEIFIRIHATTVSAGDVRIRSFTVPFWERLPARLYLGLRKPKRQILGMELAGEVAAIGSAVTRFNIGDQVFAFTGFGFGAYAEYISMKQIGSPTRDGLIALKPSNLTYGLAAAATGGALTALGFLRKGGIQRGQHVLIYGASGSVGTFAVQLARHFGAQVTGVCSTANGELISSLGAERVIDYTREDVAADNTRYDLVFDAVGKLSSTQGRRLLAPRGRFLSVRGSAPLQKDDLDVIGGLLAKGELKPVIDRSYPFEQIVEAHQYVEKGHKKGNVVITITQPETKVNAE